MILKKLVQDELDKLRVMHELRMGGIIDNDSASFEQLENNSELRTYRLQNYSAWLRVGCR